jgi:serine/threonine protein kinase
MTSASSSGSQFGPYALLYPLGAGGMGQVFLARHSGEHDIQRLVAIKRMLVHLSRRKNLVNLFLDEVRIAAQLAHGNIIQVIDHGVIGGQYYMAMEYVHGENMLEVLGRLGERQEQMPLDLVLHVGSCICQGLSHAHTKKSLDGRPLGIVHRDISPQNIMVSFQGEVKIADFGVARAAEQTHQTLGGELKGKLAYMSPEQAYGKPLDHRSDLFSLGALLYESLTGRSPFMRDNPMATLEAVRSAQVVALGTVREVPQELAELVHRALSPEVDHRPDSARAMYEELQRTMRLHNLVVSAYDLADFLADLFPESRPTGEERGAEGPRGTAVGRRADEDIERRTLFYLKQRHPGATLEAVTRPEASGTGQVRLARRRTGWLAAALVALVGVGLALYAGFGGRQPAGPLAAADAAGVGVPLRDAPRLSSVDARVHVSADARAPTALALLVVRSVPAGAQVSLSGLALSGTTPLSARVAPGHRPCTIQLAGHRPLRKQVILRPGQRTVVQARLEPLPSRLSVVSTHPCRVRVDGQLVGETPLANRAVRAGQLKVSCVDAAAGVRESRRVRVPPGGSATVSFRFGVLSINLQPWAEVTVDRRPRGTTPLRLVLPVGEHQVVLSNSERRLERRRTVEIAPSGTTRISSW